MVSHQYAERRDTLRTRARRLIKADPAGFADAGKTLDAFITDEDLIKDRPHLAESTPGVRLRFRLDLARQAAIRAEGSIGFNPKDFRGSGQLAQRKQTARVVVLAIVLSMDPEVSEVVTVQMCPFAQVPWDGHDPSDSETWLAGRTLISWIERDWENSDDPSPRVLDLLEEAMEVVESGTSATNVGLIPSGDGRPCDHPGKNPEDELERSLRDVLRHQEVFRGTSEQWVDAHRYQFGEELVKEREWLIEYTRQWWGTWEPAINRARDALAGVTRPELASLKAPALQALATLKRMFGAPLAYHPSEQPGDHLLVRSAGVLGFKKLDHNHLESNFPKKKAIEAARVISELIETLGLYVDAESGISAHNQPEESISEYKVPKRKKRKKRSETERMADESAIAIYLQEHPKATRDEVAYATGIPTGTVSQSNAWQRHVASKKLQQNESRPASGVDLDDFADPKSAMTRSSDGGRAIQARKMSGSKTRH